MSREQKEKPKAKGCVRKPTIAEARQQMADSGDVEGLWQVLSREHWSEFNHVEMCHLLLRAIEVSSRNDPAAFASEAYRRMVGFSTYLLFRVQHRLLAAIDYGDRRSQSPGPPELSQEAYKVYLPPLLELQHHLMELLTSQASTARLWALARQRRAVTVPLPEAPAQQPTSSPPEAALDDPENEVSDESQLELPRNTSEKRNGRAMVPLLHGEMVNGKPVPRLAESLNGEDVHIPEAPAPQPLSSPLQAAVERPEDKVPDVQSKPEPASHTTEQGNKKAVVHRFTVEAVNGEPVHRLAGLLNGKAGGAPQGGPTDETNDAGYLW